MFRIDVIILKFDKNGMVYDEWGRVILGIFVK